VIDDRDVTPRSDRDHDRDVSAAWSLKLGIGMLKDYRITQQDAMRQTLNNTIHVIVICHYRQAMRSLIAVPGWLANALFSSPLRAAGAVGGEAHAVDYGVRIRIFSVRIRPLILIQGLLMHV